MKVHPVGNLAPWDRRILDADYDALDSLTLAIHGFGSFNVLSVDVSFTGAYIRYLTKSSGNPLYNDHG